jgi:hypothetical protein
MENYSGKKGANVSGALLVGVTLGKTSLISNNANIVLVSPQTGAGTNLCLRVVTRDGLFWSDNPYKTPVGDSISISAGPVANRFLSDLQKYPLEDIMVLATIPLSDNCSTPKQESFILPAMGEPDGYLYIYLLTGDSAANIRLTKKDDIGGFEQRGICEKISPGSIVAVDKVCKIGFSPDMASGQYNLDVRLKRRIGMEDYHYAIYNPRKIKQ